MTEFKHIVTKEDDGQEVREIMKNYFDFSSRLRNKIKREKLVQLNGVQTPGWHKVSAGDEVKIVLPDETSHFEPQDIPLDPVFEDNDMMVINKQPGLIVHPTKGHPHTTVANALMYYQSQHGQSWKIRFVNRLDMDTSGLLVVAKNAYCQNEYTNQMRKNTVRKKYIALVKGVIEQESGTIDLPIGRPDPVDVRRGVMEDGAPSVTHYQVLERFPQKRTVSGALSTGYTLVELLLETGRTHQIRVHMSYIGHPIVGDHLYGGINPLLIGRQALHAAKLHFTHPITKKEMDVEAPLPEDMKRAIEKLR